MWGTGLGRSAARPKTAATQLSDIEVDIGGRSAEIEAAGPAPCCPGVDQIRLRVPSNAPLGCFVPLSVRLRGAVYSNVEALSISEDGSRCADLPPTDPPAVAQSAGLAVLSRSSVDGEVFDEASAVFGPTARAFRRLPAPGTCLPGLLAPELGVLPTLDAGPELSLSTPIGAILLPATPSGDAPVYQVTSPPAPPFLGPGEYTLVGGGGADVGPFSASLSIPSAPILAVPSRVGNRVAQSRLRCFVGRGGTQRNPSHPFGWMGPDLPRSGRGGVGDSACSDLDQSTGFRTPAPWERTAGVFGDVRAARVPLHGRRH